MTIPNYDLKALRATTEQILVDAKGKVEGAINWGDLHCVAALRCQDDEDRVSYRVDLQEVASDEVGLQRYVHDQLASRGFEGVEVHTEW